MLACVVGSSCTRRVPRRVLLLSACSVVPTPTPCWMLIGGWHAMLSPIRGLQDFDEQSDIAAAVTGSASGCKALMMRNHGVCTFGTATSTSELTMSPAYLSQLCTHPPTHAARRVICCA